MATVIQWGNSEGIQGRCDAKCHGATDPKCFCMCGGRYHGANHRPGGLRAAMETHENEIVSEENQRSAELGLTIRFRGIADLFYVQQSFLDEGGNDGQT